jgi:energy-coupling factor transport system ATP-binding protein
MISLTGVSVVYTGRHEVPVHALDGISLEVGRGEWLGLVGGNGSGKSTLLKVLAGVVPSSTGTLDWSDGRPPRAAMLLQDPDNQFVTTSVRHELELSTPQDAGDEERAARPREAIDRFGLGHLLDRNPHRLSGGEKQRLALGTVWLQAPELVLLDEPTSFLDAEHTAACREFVAGMHADGATVVWATHDPADVSTAQRVLALDGGVVADSVSVQTPRFKKLELALPSGSAVLSLTSVGFEYGDAPLLDAVDLRAERGECLGITGTNASGKTTLLLLSGGALTPKRGSVWRDDSRAFYLPQSPEQLFFAETVAEELAFGLHRAGVRGEEARERSASALDAVGLEPRRFLERFPFHLSLGEMRRVALAIAGSLSPGLLLLDEPTAGLDADGVDTLTRFIADGCARGAAVVIASHDHPFLDAVCHRVVQISGARLSAPGDS